MWFDATAAEGAQQQRVLVLAPNGRDAMVVCQVLGAQAIAAEACGSEELLVGELEKGASAAFITEETLLATTGALAAWIKAQPPWSDFPFVALVSRQKGRRSTAASGALRELGNVVLLERPLNAETLVTAAFSALRARARQYEARRHLWAQAQARHAEEIAKAEALRAKQALEVAVDAGELGTFHCPFPLGPIEWSKRCNEHFWLPEDARIDFDQFYLIIHPDDRDAVATAVNGAVLGTTPCDVAFRTVSPDGRHRWIRAKGRVYLDAAGQSLRFDGVTFDITHQKSLESEREDLLAAERKARLEAEQAGRMKDEFLATLSHELRTPLSAILGWTFILGRAGAAAPEVAKAASTIERNARAQARLIEELLDVSRITSGNLKLDFQPVSVAAVFEAVTQSLKPASQAKDITITLDPETSFPELLADPGRLQQVVWNLVANAVKFTERGGRVTLKAAIDGQEVVLSVSDDGLGIAADFLPHVFERFRQADSSTARSYGGLGLGLAIVRQLVELHGGTVNVTSEGIGCGSTFLVRLPVVQNLQLPALAGDAASAQVAGSAPAVDLSGLHVLVVDDESDGREMLAQLLQDRGAGISMASSADEAMVLLEKISPHLLISDIGMPKVDGYEFVRRIRNFARAKVRTIPAIALTAFARPEDATKAKTAGFDIHLPKPVEPVELFLTIADVLKSSGRGGPEVEREP
jgi:signal transduction histidine kinase/ActR/RegA family two-component response regulator